MNNLNEVAQTFWSACSVELHKKTDKTKNDEATYGFDIHMISNDINNLFVFVWDNKNDD